MYIVANISKSTIILSDLKLEIHPKQALDLHKMNLSILPERSKDLETGIRKGSLKVIKHDTGVEEIKLQTPVSSVSKDEISQIIRDEMGSNKEMLETLKELVAAIKNKENTSSQVVQQSEKTEQEPDSKILSQMQARVLQKITKNVESNSKLVDLQKETIQDNGLGKQMSDLENLL